MKYPCKNNRSPVSNSQAACKRIHNIQSILFSSCCSCKHNKHKKAQLFSWAFIFGSPTWARTRDLRINSPSLYRLSYQGIERDYMISLQSRQALFVQKSQIIALCFNLHHISGRNCLSSCNFWHISTAQARDFSRRIRVRLYQIGLGLYPL